LVGLRADHDHDPLVVLYTREANDDVVETVLCFAPELARTVGSALVAAATHAGGESR
jgi:hypothetical protein